MKYPFELGAIPVVVNPYLPPGMAFLVAEPANLPLPRMAPFALGSDAGTAAVAFRYMPLRMPDPRKFIALTNLLGETHAINQRWKRRERKLVSLKRKDREQRRLDWQSNVRRRNRRMELERRKAKR